MTAGVTSVLYGTMRGTDVAVLELDTTLGELTGAGLRAYSLNPAVAEGDVVHVVGIPVDGVEQDQQFLRINTCVAGSTSRLLEFVWVWDAAQANSCRGILGGNSGSPLFDENDEVVGIVNTTTVGAPVGGACYLGRPCEVSADGVTMQPNTSYAQPVEPWAACFNQGAAMMGYGVSSACGLEPGSPVVTVDDLAPTLPDIQADTFHRVGVQVPDPSVEFAVASGPIASTDCRDRDSYGDPQIAEQVEPSSPLASAIFDVTLADEEGISLVCVAPVVDGDVQTAQAAYVVLTIDRTPPVAPIELSQSGSDIDGYIVEPIFSTPELSDYRVLIGPAASTDCDVPLDEYGSYRRIPFRIEPTDLPVAVCVIGLDLAGNESAPVRFDLG